MYPVLTTASNSSTIPVCRKHLPKLIKLYCCPEDEGDLKRELCTRDGTALSFRERFKIEKVVSDPNA